MVAMGPSMVFVTVFVFLNTHNTHTHTHTHTGEKDYQRKDRGDVGEANATIEAPA